MPGRHAAASAGGARRRPRAAGDERGERTEQAEQPERTERSERPGGPRGPERPEWPWGPLEGWKRGSVILLASVIALFSVAGWSALSTFGSGGCGDDDTLTVAAAPELAAIVKAVASNGNEPLETSQGCLLSVQPTDPGKAVAAITNGTHAPDLWIPDTSAWLSQLPASVPDRTPRSVAKTPVVIAGPGGQRPDTWLEAMSQPGATMLDPTTTGASFGALEALHAEAVKGVTSGTTLSHWLVSAAQSAPQYSLGDTDIIQNASTGVGDTSGWFPTTEQKAISHAAKMKSAGLTTTVPRSGTILMDYPLVPVATGAEADAASEAARLLSQRLASRAAEQRLQSAGFRPEAGTPTNADGSVGTVTELGVVQPQAAGTLLNTWVSLSSDARMLAVLDVSESMEDYAAGGRTRVQLTRDAATSALQDLPVTWQMGLWAFSSGLGRGDNDYRELVPVRELGDQYGKGTQRDRLTGAIQQLPSLTAGGTGLYDTALAAYRSAVAGYDPQRFNGVLLLTDGRNDDDGISLDRLLATLRSQRDPSRPVRLITIGVGPDADASALRRMAEATGGRNYVVRDPRDLEAVFNDALLERVGWGLQ